MKTWIWLGVIVAVAGGIYFYVSGKPTADSSLQANAVDATGAVGAQVLALLGQVRTLNIDVSFFNDPIFNTLHDFTVPIPSQIVGRPNPFAPLPGDVITPVPSTATSKSATSH